MRVLFTTVTVWGCSRHTDSLRRMPTVSFPPRAEYVNPSGRMSSRPEREYAWLCYQLFRAVVRPTSYARDLVSPLRARPLRWSQPSMARSWLRTSYRRGPTQNFPWRSVERYLCASNFPAGASPVELSALHVQPVRAVTNIRPVSEAAVTPATVPWTVTAPDVTAFPVHVTAGPLPVILPTAGSVGLNVHPVTASVPPVAEAVQTTAVDEARTRLAGVQVTLMRGAA